MGIIFLTESITEYLSISSALLLILGLLSFLWVKSLMIQGKAKLCVLTLIIILPLSYPLKTLFPESVKIPVRMELNSFKKNIEPADPKDISTNTSLFSNNLHKADEVNKNESALIEREAPRTGIKNRLSESISVLARNWRLTASAAWGVVFFFFLIRVITTGYKINKVLRHAVPVTVPKTIKLLHQCAADTGLRHTPRLYTVEGISTPMVMGFFRPGIIIPGHLLKNEFHEGLRFTLLHELKHLQQHHNWWLLIESIIGAAYFFHPVFHWAKRKIHEELEHICDSHVIHVTNRSVSYADFLLNQIWQQNSARNPALALPFVSTVSKTAARIHSILENTVPAHSMHIRDRISVFFVLMVFPLILLFSIAPSVQHPNQTLNMLNPLKLNVPESIDNIRETGMQETKAPIIEKPSAGYSNEDTSYIEKAMPLLKEAGTTETPASIIREKPAIKPARDSINPPNVKDEEELPAEAIEETPAPGRLESLNVTDTVTGNNMLWKQDATDKGEAADKPIAPVNIAEKYLGSPVNELSIPRIDNIRVLDEYTVLFMMRGGEMYLTRLSEPCPILLHASDFNLVSTNGRLSKFDRIQAISYNQVIGTSGMLSSFYPYRYEGNKYKAIKLLKKSLLTELVNEGAFKDFHSVKG